MQRGLASTPASTERPLDLRVVELVRALARKAALEDHRRALAQIAARRAGEAKE